MRRLRSTLVALSCSFALAFTASTRAHAQDAVLTFSSLSLNSQPNLSPWGFIFTQPIPPNLYSYARLFVTATITSSTSAPVLSGFSADGSAGTALPLQSLGLGFSVPSCTGAVNVTTVCLDDMHSAAFSPTFFSTMGARYDYTASMGTSVSVSGRLELFIDAPSTVVPEPATFALLAAGLGALGLATRRRRSA